METTIFRTTKLSEMISLNEVGTIDFCFYFDDSNSDYIEKKKYKFLIKLIHSEDTNADELFDKALSKIKKEALKKRFLRWLVDYDYYIKQPLILKILIVIGYITMKLFLYATIVFVAFWGIIVLIGLILYEKDFWKYFLGLWLLAILIEILGNISFGRKYKK
jgi:hypothetical protein